jgi:WD40 repeat protein
VWEATTGKLVWHTPLAPAIGVLGNNAGPAFVAFTQDNQHVVAAGRRDHLVKYDGGTVAVFDAATGIRKRETDLESIRWAALASNGRMVVVVSSHGAWDDAHMSGVELDTGRTRWTNPPTDERAGFVQIAAMLYEGTSSFLEVALRDGNVIRFNGLTGREQRRFLADGRPPDQKGPGRPKGTEIYTAAFSADGRRMATSSGEWVCVWDIEAGTLERKIHHTSADGCYLAVAPDGKTIATAGISYAAKAGDDTIRLYDAGNGEPVLTLEAVDDCAHTLAFSPDGTKLLTGLQRGSLIVWDVRRNGKR